MSMTVVIKLLPVLLPDREPSWTFHNENLVKKLFERDFLSFESDHGAVLLPCQFPVCRFF